MTSISVVIDGNDMSSLLQDSPIRIFEESEIFVVRFRSHGADMEAMDAMGKIGKVHTRENGENIINGKQLEELKRLKIPYELVAAVPSYRPPITGVRRR